MNNFNKIFEKKLDDLEFIALLSVNKKLFSTQKMYKMANYTLACQLMYLKIHKTGAEIYWTLYKYLGNYY